MEKICLKAWMWIESKHPEGCSRIDCRHNEFHEASNACSIKCCHVTGKNVRCVVIE